MYVPLGPFPWRRRRKPLSLKSAWIVRPALKFAPRRQSDLRQNREWEAFNVYHARSTATIKVGNTGACQRFVNWDGELVRNIPLQRYEDVKEIVGEDHEEVIRRPLITGIGAGTTYPDTKPAPYIVQSRMKGIDVVTVVTEAPLSYSGIKVKVDTDLHMGNEGATCPDRKKEGGTSLHRRIWF